MKIENIACKIARSIYISASILMLNAKKYKWCTSIFISAATMLSSMYRANLISRFDYNLYMYCTQDIYTIACTKITN